jgi:hypothetical protein
MRRAWRGRWTRRFPSVSTNAEVIHRSDEASGRRRTMRWVCQPMQWQIGVAEQRRVVKVRMTRFSLYVVGTDTNLVGTFLVVSVQRKILGRHWRRCAGS